MDGPSSSRRFITTASSIGTSPAIAGTAAASPAGDIAATSAVLATPAVGLVLGLRNRGQEDRTNDDSTLRLTEVLRAFRRVLVVTAGESARGERPAIDSVGLEGFHSLRAGQRAAATVAMPANMVDLIGQYEYGLKYRIYEEDVSSVTFCRGRSIQRASRTRPR